jgi:NIMA (never in mitosis gene a)-related kinase
LRHADQQEYVVKEIRVAELCQREQISAVNEVRLLAKIKCTYVVKYYDYYLDSESLHIVMEFCNKGDLAHLIKRCKEKGAGDAPGLRYDIIWSVILQIILGLEYLHSAKILHRDLKSANVFLNSKSGRFDVKIGDLGVAKLLDTSTAFAQTIVGII